MIGLQIFKIISYFPAASTPRGPGAWVCPGWFLPQDSLFCPPRLWPRHSKKQWNLLKPCFCSTQTCPRSSLSLDSPPARWLLHGEVRPVFSSRTCEYNKLFHFFCRNIAVALKDPTRGTYYPIYNDTGSKWNFNSKYMQFGKARWFPIQTI